MGSLAAEGRARHSQVGLHTLSPGMIITDLLLSGATVGNKVHPPCCFATPKKFFASNLDRASMQSEGQAHQSLLLASSRLP